MRKELTDNQWGQIKGMIPSNPNGKGRPALCSRIIINAILWILRTGAPWRDLPDFYGNWKSVYTRFSRWSKQGIWQEILEVLSQDCDNEYKSIDGSVVRAHQHSAGHKVVRSIKH